MSNLATTSATAVPTHAEAPYKPRAPHTTNDSRLANDLNEFYCRFERQLDYPEPYKLWFWDCPEPALTSRLSPLPHQASTSASQLMR